MPRPDGLTDDEGVVMDALSAAGAAYDNLEAAYSADKEEFVGGIHALKNKLALRVARREFPDGDGWFD